MDTTARTVGDLLVRAYRPLVERRTWYATLYHLLDLPIAWAALVIVGVAAFSSLVLAPLALVVVAGLLAWVRSIARLERSRARRLLGTDVAEPPVPVRDEGFIGWVSSSLRDTGAWRAVLYLLARFVLGNLAFFAVSYAWLGTVASLTAPAWAGPVYSADFSRIIDTWWELSLVVLVGLVALAVVPRIVHGLAGLSGWTVEALLGPPVDARIAALEGQRSSAVRAADVDRRRIEQDLHDGAQVRLTALAMQLGLTREAIAEGADGDRVAELVDDAHAQAKLALREIRDLARGIHPAILTDRGLDAALTSMVGRLPVPVELEVDVADRPSPEVESIVYFVAAEAVTNAVRHADSQWVGLRVVHEDGELVVEVRDRGRGGADTAQGTGLANLRERVEASGGELTVVSPACVGTLIRAVVPCGW